MVNLTKNLHDDVTYWQITGTNRYGKTTFGAPVVLKGRWEERSEMIRAKNGQEIVSKSRVYLLEDVELDGYLYLGVSNDADPSAIDGAYEIQMKGRIPDLRNLTTLYTAFL